MGRLCWQAILLYVWALFEDGVYLGLETVDLEMALVIIWMSWLVLNIWIANEEKYDGLEWVVALYDEIFKMTCSMLAIHGEIGNNWAVYFHRRLRHNQPFKGCWNLKKSDENAISRWLNSDPLRTRVFLSVEFFLPF